MTDPIDEWHAALLRQLANARLGADDPAFDKIMARMKTEIISVLRRCCSELEQLDVAGKPALEVRARHETNWLRLMMATMGAAQ